MCFVDTIRRNIDQGRLTGAVFIDLRKAFDTVNHEVSLSKLRGLGVMLSGSGTIYTTAPKLWNFRVCQVLLSLYLLGYHKGPF